MSVYRTDFIVYGFQMPYKEDYFEDEFLPYIEGHEELEYQLIVDGMCGEYVVFGKVLGTDNDNSGWEFTEIKTYNIDPEALKKKYQELFGDIPEEPKLFIFSHFS